MTAPRSPTAEYLRFLAWAVLAAAGVALLGAVPTARLGGAPALRAMVAGCALAALASAAGAIPVALAQGADPARRVTATLAAMGLRLLVLVALGAAVLLSGWFAPKPLLIWTAIGYLAELVVDTLYAARRLKT
jgi:hypothetical protein